VNRKLLALVLLQLLACSSGPIHGTAAERLPTGTWGGEHVELTVTTTGAHLEFDCANGDVAQPLTTDDSGRLDVEGVFTREHGGPIRDDEAAARVRARYSGRLTKNALTFDVTLIDSKENAGSFTVVLGETGRVRKCR
jgi:hypothetical protein